MDPAMAYVHPRQTPRDLGDALLRHGARITALAAYAAAVTVAIVLLAPVLFAGGSRAASIQAGLDPIVYTAKKGETLTGIAAMHGLSQARLFALNPGLAPLTSLAGQQIVVGLH